MPMRDNSGRNLAPAIARMQRNIRIQEGGQKERRFSLSLSKEKKKTLVHQCGRNQDEDLGRRKVHSREKTKNKCLLKKREKLLIESAIEKRSRLEFRSPPLGIVSESISETNEKCKDVLTLFFLFGL